MRVGGKNIKFVGSILLIETDKHIDEVSWNRGIYVVCTLKVRYF